jgi:hypothetical protein
VSAGLSTAVANAALSNIIGTDWAYAQLHTASPGTAGTTAVSTVTTRQAITWGSPSSASVAASNSPAWTSWAGTNGETDTYISGWSASTSGTFGGSMALSASVTMDTGDSLTLTSITITIPTAS